uniref:Uncharacterized protein n=2 Tax=Knipowitschia caucasica TaxID=637954 RepID=A0AAV2L5I4_KNICA
MAANRIVRVTNNNHVLPRCKSEGTLNDVSEGISSTSFNHVKVPSPSALRLDTSSSLGAVQEVVAIKDYCPSSFTTLKFSKGDRLFVLDTSGGEWWYAHNNTEMGYIPATYVQPLHFRSSTLSDSGMIDGFGEDHEEGLKEFGEWTNGVTLKPAAICNPFSINPPKSHLDQNGKSKRNSTDLILFENPPLTISNLNTSSVPNGFTHCHYTSTPITSPIQEYTSDFFRSKRSHSLSELSVLQAQSNPSLSSSGFFTGLKAPLPEQFQSREDFRTAWLNHRKLARSCHDLDSLGQSPGWGQTQPVETSIVCNLDSNGGVVQLPDTNISVHIPEGHVSSGDYQQISMKAMLDPPLELNGDHCSTVSPVVEIKLSNMEIKSFIALEIKLSISIKNSSNHEARMVCVRSDCKEGPYIPIPNAYIYNDTVQVQLDSLEPCMYVAVVVRSVNIRPNSTVWDHVRRKVTLGLYGPKHIHPTFRIVVAMFGHDCTPKNLLVNEVGRQTCSAPPVSLQLWGKHQFVLEYPQDLKVGLYSNMSNYQVKSAEGAGMIQGFQVKLGKVTRLLYRISALDPSSVFDFTLRVQAFADALGYGNLPLHYFCRTELDSEPEKVASVLEKLKEECTNMDVKENKSFQRELMMALLKMDCQGLVARLVLDFVLLTTAVEVACRWRELADKLARVSRQQMDAYEAPHRDKNGLLDNEAMWKPAYDFLLTWAAQIGDSYRDVIQELHAGLDRMRNPITRKWRHLTGTLILVNCLDSLRSSAFSPSGYGDYAI